MKKQIIMSIFLTLIFAVFVFCANKQFSSFFLISFTIISFSIFYKIISSLNIFKNIEQKSEPEILFLLVFFILLFIPLSHIDKSHISEQENRTLAELKPFITEEGKINYNYGNEFNEWFNDRFNFRNQILKLNSLLRVSANKNLDIKKDGFIDRQTGFMYYNRNFYRYSKKETIQNLNPLIELNELCKKNNIKLYVLITPPKDEIYKPTSSITVQKENNAFENYVKYLNEQKGLHIYYPINEFNLEAKNNYVYFKTDDHWTDDGAFTGYNILLNEIKKDFPNVKILTNNDFNYSYNKLIRCDWERKYTYGRTATKLGLFNHEKYHTTPYRYYTHKDFHNLKTKTKNEPLHREKDFYYQKGANYKAILLGTSQNENLTEFIPFTFKNVKRIRTNNIKGLSLIESKKIMKYWQKDIIEYKPDILIFCMTYDNISQLQLLFKK